MNTAYPLKGDPLAHPIPFELLVNEVVDYAIFMLDPGGRILTWNKGAERIKGWRADEIVGQHFSRFYPASDVKAGKCEYELEVAERVGRFEDEDWRVRADGSRFWANVIITALKDEAGTLRGFAKVTRDLTVRKQAEETARRLAQEEAARSAAQAARARAEALAIRTQRLQESTAAFGAALSREDVLAVIRSQVLPALEANGGSVALVTASEAELELIWHQGYTRENVTPYQHFPLSASLPHSDAARTQRPVFLGSREAINAAYPAVRDTNTLGALASIPMTVGGSCIGVLGITRTLETTFSAEDQQFAIALAGQCAQALERARILQLERQRAEFAQDLMAIVSHDLRSPISAILMGAATVLRRPDIDERLRATMNRVLSSGHRATRLIHDILDFTQAKAGGGISIQRRPLDLGELCSQVVDEVRLGHSERTVSVVLVGDLRGQWDPDRLAQVITNLVGNALEHSPDRTPVGVRVAGSGDGVVLSVSNEGPPIPVSEIPELFDAYRRRRTEDGARKSRGIGLGLYISRQLVEAHHGTIVAESNPVTTTFTVRLPRE